MPCVAASGKLRRNFNYVVCWSAKWTWHYTRQKTFTVAISFSIIGVFRYSARALNLTWSTTYSEPRPDQMFWLRISYSAVCHIATHILGLNTPGPNITCTAPLTGMSVSFFTELAGDVLFLFFFLDSFFSRFFFLLLSFFISMYLNLCILLV